MVGYGDNSMTRVELPRQVSDGKVVAIARRLAPGSHAVLADALLRGGIGVLEITMDSDGAAVTIEAMAATGLFVGAGTVLNAHQAEEAVASGASFIVSPHTDEGVVRWCVDHAVPVMPGAVTPSEIVRAWDLGASAVKLFPASVGGPGYLAAIRGPLGHIPIIPTGGIDASNAREYLDAGAVAVGVGGWLTASFDADTVHSRASELAEVVSRA